MIKHINNSFEKAEKDISKLDPEILSIEGLTGNKIKHMLNNIIDFSGANHLEIGVNKGATLTASLYKNKPNVSYAIEINTKYNELLSNLKTKFNLNYTYLNEDCFDLDLSKIKEKINVYFFDAEHRYEDHYKSLEYYYPILDDEFIFIVDDWAVETDPYYKNWKQVSIATLDAIKDLNLKITYQITRPRSPGWHQGIWVSLLKK